MSHGSNRTRVARGSRDSGESHLPRSRLFLQLVLPESIEAARRELGISDCMLNVFVSQVMLDRPRIVTVIGELEPTGMAQHMWVDRKAQSCELAGPSDDLTHG